MSTNVDLWMDKARNLLMLHVEHMDADDLRFFLQVQRLWLDAESARVIGRVVDALDACMSEGEDA